MTVVPMDSSNLAAESTARALGPSTVQDSFRISFEVVDLGRVG